MDRREFVANSVAAAAGAALIGKSSYSATPKATDQPYGSVPGAISESVIQQARFPEGFIWGAATASYQVEGHGMRTAKANRSGTGSRIRQGKFEVESPATLPATNITFTGRTSLWPSALT